jgi:transposase
MADGADDAWRGELTPSRLATKHSVHQTMVSDWKRQAMEGLVSVFPVKAEARDAAREDSVS